MATESNLTDRLAQYLSAPADERSAALRTLLGELRQAIAAGGAAEAAAVLQKAVLPSSDYTAFQSLYRVFGTLRTHWRPAQTTRLAVLGGFTTTQLAQAVELALFAMGAGVELFEADYGVYRQEIFDPGSALYRFAPKTIFLATSWRDLIRRPGLDASREDVQRCVEAELSDWQALWRTAHERSGCQILQNNFDRPDWRQ